MPHNIRLMTHQETLAIGEIEGVRERNATEKVHYRSAFGEPCKLCDEEDWPDKPIVWFDSIDRWKVHSFRCVAVRVR